MKLSPTSTDFNFNENVSFKLFLQESSGSRELNHPDIKNNTVDTLFLNIDAKNGYDDFVDFFRLKGRYNAHKKEAIRLVELKRKYSTSQLNQITKLLNQNKTNPTITQTIIKDIFGKEIFEGELQEKPFTKLKRDIAKQIGLNGVKDD